MAKKKGSGALAKEPSKGPQNTDQARWAEKYNNALRNLKKQKPNTNAYDRAVRELQRWGPKSGIANWDKPIKNYKPPTAEDKFARMTPEQRRNALTLQAEQGALDIMQQGQQFDINRPFAGYEMGFGEARDKAYTDIMNQFNRSMEPEFQRQNAEFQQRMADQGLDPSSGAYQAQYKALADAQNSARLNAQSQASQQAYQVQQQAFQQGQEASLQPLEFYKATFPMIQMPWEQAGQVNLANISGQYGLKQQAAQNAAAIQQANIAAQTSRANTQAQIEAENERYRREQLNQYPQGNPPKKPTFGQGVQSGVPGGILAGSQS